MMLLINLAMKDAGNDVITASFLGIIFLRLICCRGESRHTHSFFLEKIENL
jgi:hypothetical protein